MRRLASLALLAAALGCQSPPASVDAGAAAPPRAPGASPASASAAASVPPPPSAAPAPAPRASGPGRVAGGSLRSAALGVEKRYLVYLPAGYDGGAARFPVIYLLHGLGGDETNWVSAGNLAPAADGLGLAAIVVMPDGDDGFYVNWASPGVAHEACLAAKPEFNPAERPESYCVKRPRYEDYIVKDLVAHVDATYRTVPERRARAVTGLSMGGFGALSLALRNRGVFASAASHSGLVALLYGGPHPYVKGKAGPVSSLGDWGGDYREPFRNHIRRVFGADIATWRAHDPSQLAAELRDGELGLYLDCGTEDGFKFQDHALYVHEVLESKGVGHTFELLPGPHTFVFWKARIDESLAFHAERFRRAGL